MEKPFAPSCERNQAIILEKLSEFLPDSPLNILEIGSGTGQHAVYFCENKKLWNWQCSDFKENHQGIQLWLDESSQKLKSPIEFDMANAEVWPEQIFDAVFTANTFHIAPWSAVENFCENAGQVVNEYGWLFVYGPFKYKGEFTSPSNAQFEHWLKARDSRSGVRDFENISRALSRSNFKLVQDISMPANNQFLAFKRQ